MTVKDGTATMHPVSFGVGNGRIVTNVTMTPVGAAASKTNTRTTNVKEEDAKAADGQPGEKPEDQQLRTRADVDFRQVDLARLMSATHMFGGAGTIGGRAEIEGTGATVAGVLAHGNGEVKLFMTGGDISALLVDLSGLEFGNALLASLGLPKRTPVRCMVTDFVLQNGIMNTRMLLLDTEAANVTGKGTINLRNESLDLQLHTEPKHFTIGSLATPINITGTLKHPTVGPAPGELAARGGIAAGLAALLTPLGALLPTIQLGLGEDNDCNALIRNAQRSPNPAEKKTTR
jgi:uncharacterized protein involved in outer membrane biogenesis